MEIHFAAKSDIGQVRSTNEDYFLQQKISDEEYLFVVADGMGGHQAGDVASRTATQTFLEIYQQFRKKGKSIAESAQNAILRVNARILKISADDISRRGMGTTFSALIVHKMRGYVVHVGDSRIYLTRGGKLKQVTTDHSFVEKLVENGQLTREEARDHPQKNVLYMSVGAKDGFTPEYIFDFEIQNGDSFLICSDGLTNMVSESELLYNATQHLPQDAVEKLVALANSRGGTDNITVQAISFGSWNTLEKTNPEGTSARRRRFLLPFLALALLALAGYAAYRFYFRESGAVSASGELAAVKAGSLADALQLVKIEVPSSADLVAPGSHPLLMVGGDLYYQKENAIRSLSVFSTNWNIIGTRQDAEPFLFYRPRETPQPFYLKKAGSGSDGYEIISLQGQTVLTLAAKSVREIAGSAAVSVRVEGLAGPLRALYADDIHLVLRDSARILVVRNWLTDDARLLERAAFAISEESLIRFKNEEGRLTIMVLDLAGKSLREIRGDELNLERQFDVDILEPLDFEIRRGSPLFYFADGMVRIVNGRIERTGYLAGAEKLKLQMVVTDLIKDLRIGITSGGEIYQMGYKDD